VKNIRGYFHAKVRERERERERKRDGQEDSDGNNVSSKILKDHHSSLKLKCWILREIDF